MIRLHKLICVQEYKNKVKIKFKKILMFGTLKI